jgi:hypothetical protein
MEIDEHDDDDDDNTFCISNNNYVFFLYFSGSPPNSINYLLGTALLPRRVLLPTGDEADQQTRFLSDVSFNDASLGQDVCLSQLLFILFLGISKALGTVRVEKIKN